MKQVVIIFFAVALSALSAKESIRTWTNNAGKEIQAKLLKYDGKNVTLSMGMRDYTISADTLSQADRDYLEAYLAEQTPMENSGSTETGNSSSKARTGSFNMRLSAKMFSEPKDYYNSKIGKSTRKALEDNNTDPLQIVSFLAEDEEANFYIPNHYDGSTPFGVYININAGDGPNCPQEYQRVMDRHNMIMSSPKGAGNKEKVMRRIALALDTLATIQKDYKVDLERIYISGFSGGGITALEAQLMYPDIWKGAFSHARGMGLGNYGAYYSETKSFNLSDFKRASRMKQRIAILSGPKDYNYDHCKKTVEDWDDHGFNIEFFETSKGHNMAPAEALEQALNWVDKN